MDFIHQYGKETFSALVALTVWGLSYFFKTRPKLHLAQPHAFTYLIDEPLRAPDGKEIQPRQTVHTQAYWVQNSGRETATKVELVFNFEPKCINIWPVRNFERKTLPDQRCALIFDSLAPGEVLGCHILNINNDLPNLLYVRCDQGAAKSIDMRPQPIVGPARVRVAVVLMLFGLGAVIYLAVLLLQFLVLRTPYGH